MAASIPETLLRQVVATYAPRRVILFGSHAREEAGPDSDLDLLVVLDDDAPPEALHWRRRHEARRGYAGAVDIIPCREGVLRDRARAPGSLAAAALREGVTVYERR
jgi:predicted nucleotidyltransferase